MCLFEASIASSLFAIVAFGNRLSVLDDAKRGFTFDLAQRAQDADDMVSSAVGISVLLMVATGIVFIIWQWRMAKNAELLGAREPRFSPGWSIGGWFIPFANFVIPVLIFQELWRASTPGARPESWKRESGSGLVALWWTVFLLSNLVVRAVNTDDGNTLDALRTTNQVLLGAYVLSVVAAVVTIFVVIQLTRRFDIRRSELGAA